MDAIDINILKILQHNAKTSLADISKEVSLSPSAIGERIKKLESSGVISQYTAILSGTHFHKELCAYMFISLESPNFTESFLEFVNNEEDILECHYMTGNFDYIIKIITNNPPALESILTRIKSVKGITKTYTNVVLATEKNNFSVSPKIK